MEHDPLEDTEVTFLLGLAFQVILCEFVNRLDAAGYADVRPMHGLVFQALAGAEITSTELAERLGVTKQAVGQMINDLEQRGYVKRSQHPAGGRRRLIVLTDKAQTHLGVAGQVMYKLESQLAEQLDDVALARLRAELVRIIRGTVGDAVPPLRPVW